MSSSGKSTATSAPARTFAAGTLYVGETFSAGLGTLVMAINTMYAQPFPVGATRTFDRFSVNFTAAGAAGTIVRCGIYRTTAGLPDALLAELGSIDGVVGGDPAMLTINQTLSDPLYWLTAVAQVGTPTVRSAPSLRSIFSGRTDTSASFTNHFVASAAVAGALPASFGAVSVVPVLPLLSLRAA